ncbi:MAG: ABC transporter ATP-binding protein [Anaerolineae bacterium]
MTIRFEQLTHIYKSPAAEPRKVLDIPEWRIAAGEQLLLRGVSGSGKTTLFNITAGLLRPTTGTVRFDDQSLYALPEAARDRFRARNIGYIFQTHYLLNTLTALENVVMPMAFGQAVPRGQWRARARDLLGQVGLGDHVDYRPAQMSTGQRMRVAVARALVNQPRLVLADEPTASLDEQSAQVVMALIQQTCRETNATLLVASHDPALQARFAQVVHLHAGELSRKEMVL